MISLVVNLSKIRRPSRYINNEINSIRKAAAPLRVALAFPDAYEVGMSHLGLRILYDIVNGIPFASAERVFHPWVDYEEAMRREGLPLCSMESGTPLEEFDVLGFSLQYELSYTSVLNMLSLGGIPLRSGERSATDPLVIAGGPCTVNPLPMLPFMDAFVIGDAEESVVEIVTALNGLGKGHRDEALKVLSAIDGVYVPSVHGTAKGAVRRRFIDSLEDAPFPVSPVVPYAQIVHDRANIEVARGCARGCRFCQAGMTYRPVRERSPEKALKIAEETIRRTGYDEVSFLSLSVGDYCGLTELVKGFNRRFRDQRISVSLPSLRVKSVEEEVLKEIVAVRKTGFTIAPEAATARLRACINKDFTEEDFERSLELLFSAGWLNLKLYYMIGLPTETDEDVEAIPPMVLKALKTAKRHTSRFVNISVSVSPFIPKAHTPFQWEGQEDTERLREKRRYLRGKLRKINFRDHDEETSLLEAAFARGDKGISDLLEAAWREGARLEGWSETFDFGKWQKAMQKTGIDAAWYARRKLPLDEALPWEVVDTGISRGFLLDEHKRAMEAVNTPGCMDSCSECGLDCTPKEAREANWRLPPVKDAPVRKPIRVRACFSKTGGLRYLSHRELMTHMTRALNRAGVFFDYTKGFHPTPKVAFGPPLGVGVAGLNEYFDMEVLPMESLETLRERLNGELGDGVEVHSLAPVGFGEKSLQSFITTYLYEVTCQDVGPLEEFARKEKVEALRKNRRINIRPMLLEADVISPVRARVLLSDLPEAQVRLEEVAEAMFGSALEELDIIRLSVSGPKGRAVPPFEGADEKQRRCRT